MQFIAKNTSIPVPKVYCSFRRGKNVYIVMERLQGDMLVRSWRGRSEESRVCVLRQLKRLVAEMRDIPAPISVGVGSVDGGSLFECRLVETGMVSGPS